MTEKCAKCIDHFREEKRRMDLVNDLKAKNESMSHAFLKTNACNILRELGNSIDCPMLVDTEVSVKGIGKIDVVGQVGQVTIAVECGRTNPNKILALKKHFDIVLHIPYCYSWGLVKIDLLELEYQLLAELVDRKLKKEGMVFERHKQFCLEEGECSLPSGRDGYPQEAMQIAGLQKPSR